MTRRAMPFGMTLVEVLLALTVLSFGLIFVYRPLLSSLNALAHAEARLEAGRLMADQIWELQARLQSDAWITGAVDSHTVLGARQPYALTWRIAPLVSDGGLAEASLVLSWTAGGKKWQVKRNLYLLNFTGR